MRERVWIRWPELLERIDRWRALGDETTSSSVQHIGRLANGRWLITLYPGLSSAEIAMAEARIGVRVPDTFRSFLSCSNGARLFDSLSIFGSVPALNRKLEQPIDLWAENILRPEGALVFGGVTAWSGEGKLVILPDGVVHVVPNEAPFHSLAKWASLESFLLAEIDRLNGLHASDGRFLGRWSDYLPPGAESLETERPNERAN
ncbi:MAG: SMI1/KNR4 family protein [Hyphomonadaceae bacterium]